MPLLIADGHHRYETAVAFREEEPSATHTFAVLVSSRSPGLEIFPTHRIVDGRRRRARSGFMTSTWDTRLARDVPDGQLLPARVRRRARHARDRAATSLQGVEYTPDAQQAIDGGRPGAGDARVPRPRAVGRAGVRVRARAARRCRRRRRSSTRSSPPACSASTPSDEPLARAVPRGGRRREGRARGDADARGARAAGRPGQGRRHHRGARRGGRAASCSRTSTVPDVRIVSEEIGIKGDGRDHGRRRPDRRLAERRAGDPVLRALRRGRRGHDDGRRRLRVRPRLRLRRGVDGGARRRRVPERRAADGRARRTRSSSCRSRRRGPSSCSTELAKLAPLTDRVRIMGAQAITFCHLAAGRTDAVVVPQAVARGRLRRLRSCSSASAASRSTRSTGRELGTIPLDLEAPLAHLRRGHARSSRSESPRRYAPSAWNRSRDAVLAALANVIDPELRKPVTELDMVRDDRDRRRRRDGHDRAHRRRLPAAQLVPGAGRARGRRGRGRHVGAARVRRDEPRRARGADDEAPRRPARVATRRSSSTRRRG